MKPKLSITTKQAIELGLCEKDQIWYDGKAFKVEEGGWELEP